MLGYIDTNASVSDPGSAFVLFSNVRIVEMSPYITNLAASVIVTQGTPSITFTSGAAFSQNPITNVWYRGTNAGPPSYIGLPTVALQTNTANDIGLATTLTVTNSGTTNVGTLNNFQNGTNFYSVFSDAAGFVTNVAIGEVVNNPANGVATTGSNAILTVTFSGNMAPTVFQWYAVTNGGGTN